MAMRSSLSNETAVPLLLTYGYITAEITPE